MNDANPRRTETVTAGDGTGLYRVTVTFLDGSTEVIPNAARVDYAASGTVEVRYGTFSVAIFNLAHVRSISALSGPDRPQVDSVAAEPDAPGYVECGDRGPRAGENVAWCGRLSGHTDACRDAGLGVAW